MHAINFLGAAWRLPLEERWSVQATVAAAYYPRIHARASGAFDEGDFESLFLRYLLPGISGTFDGDIDTKTKSYRLAMAVAPSQGSRWSAGFYVERIDCKSTFCGVHATSNGFTTSSTGATAIGVGAGARYRLSPPWTVAGSVSDIRTRLTVNSVTTDAAGTRTMQVSAQFPRKITAAVAWQAASDTLVVVDYEGMPPRDHAAAGPCAPVSITLEFGAPPSGAFPLAAARRNRVGPGSGKHHP